MMYVKIDKKIFASIILLFFLLMSIYNIKAEEEKYKLIFKTGEPALIRVPCFNEGNYCSDAAVCKITIIYKNDVLVKDEIMQNEGAFHTYNFTNTSRSGEYITTVVCEDSGSYGFSTFSFEINPSGSKSNNIFLAIVLAILFLFSMFLFIGGMLSKSVPLLIFFILFGFIFLIFAFNVLIISPDISLFPELSEVFGTLYMVILYLFLGIMLLLIIYAIFELVQWHKFKKQEELKKWGLWIE